MFINQQELIVVIACLAALVGLVAAFLGFWNQYAIRELHRMMNSRLDQLVAASIDKGRLLERNEHRLATLALARSAD